MHGERILLTGASGFLGAALVPKLLARGAEVHALSRRAAHPTGGGVRWRTVDLEDERAVRAAVAEIAPQRIVHLASLVVGRRELGLVLPALRANLLSTVHLLIAATESGCGRIVLAGSMEEPEPGAPPSSPYAAAKAAASGYAQLFHALYGLPVVVARIFMVYGPGQIDRTKLVPATIEAALAGVAPQLSSGERAVDWIHVDDVADGLVALAELPGIEGETLDLGTGVATPVRDVAATICRLAGAPPPRLGALPDRPLEVTRVADPERTFARTGFRPRIALDEGLALTLEVERRWLAAALGSGPEGDPQ